MLIGIDASRANKRERTGTEWYSYNLIKQLAKIDQKNTYILYTKEPLREDLRNLGKNFKNRVLHWPPKYLWNLFRLSIEMIFRPPDILFVPAHTIPLISPKKTVTTCHDVGFEEFPHLYATSFIGGNNIFARFLALILRVITLGRYSNNELDYHRFSMRLAVKKAARIISPSLFTAREIEKYYRVEKGKIKVIYEGYDQNKYKDIGDQEEIRKIKEKYNINYPFILFVGRLEKKKNILGVIKSFKLLKDNYKKPLKLMLVGREGWGWAEAAAYIKENSLTDEILRLGWVEGDDLPYFYNLAQVLIFISYYEGFGLPPLEAMACGCPVVASKRASIPEIVGEAAICVDPDNHQKISQELLRILNDENFRKILIEKGKKRARQFSWQKCAAETLKIILET